MNVSRIWYLIGKGSSQEPIVQVPISVPEWLQSFGWKNLGRAVVVAQLVEQSLPTLDVRGSKPIFGKPLNRTFMFCQLYWKDKNKEKDAGNGRFFKKAPRYGWTQSSTMLYLGTSPLPLRGSTCMGNLPSFFRVNDYVQLPPASQPASILLGICFSAVSSSSWCKYRR